MPCANDAWIVSRVVHAQLDDLSHCSVHRGRAFNRSVVMVVDLDIGVAENKGHIAT